MRFLDNGTVRVGIDLNLGGAITWLSKSGGENMVNNFDLGRQIQMSHYSGPVPFNVGDKKPSKHWEHLGWNPIQAGDDFGNGSRTIEHTNKDGRLYTKCIPMQWPLEDVPADCTFETWVQLEENVVHLRCRVMMRRKDKTKYPARLQEMPAMYLNAPYHRLMSYTGAKPFTNGVLTEIHRPGDKPEKWAEWLATERWAALVNDDGQGVGLWNPACLSFIGGFDGKLGPNDPRGNSTGYLAPQSLVMLEHDMHHDFHCELIVGTLTEIRDRVFKQSSAPEPPHWHFDLREGWRVVNAELQRAEADRGNRLLLERDDPQVISPPTFFYADDAPFMKFYATFKTRHREAEVFWRRFENGKSVPGGSMTFPIQGDGQWREYTVRLADSPEWRGAIVELRLDPVPSGAEGEWFDLGSVGFGK